MFLFPFDSVPKDCNAIIYGAGDVGGQYLKQIQLTEWCNIIAVADQNWKRIKKSDVRICAPDVVDYEAADAIIIAVEDLQTAEKIKEKLNAKGINNIVWHIIRYNGADEHAHIIEYDSYLLNDDAVYAHGLELDKRKALVKMLNSLKIYSCSNINLIRIGCNADGGYVMNEIKAGRVAYSIGIGQEISWDADMANRNFDIYMYDYTVDDLPYSNKHFHFFQKGITGVETNDSTFYTLEKALKENNHNNQKQMILKMDIEGAEWSVFEKLSDGLLERFEQMVFEIHGLLKKEKWDYYAECLNRLTKTHALIHLHGNNACRYALIEGMRLPDCLELTYIKRGKEIFSEDDSTLPRIMDYPNIVGLDEIELGKWNAQIDELIRKM